MTEDSTKQRILFAAGPIFAQNGYRASTVRDISVAADVNLASINYYFGDKQTLYVQTIIAARQMQLESNPTPQFDPTADPEAQLREYIQLLVNRMVAGQNPPWQIRLLAREFISPSDGCREIVEDIIRPSFERLIQILGRVTDGKLLRHRLLKIGFSIIGQCLHYRSGSEINNMFLSQHDHDQHFDLKQIADHITEFSLGAIRQIKLSVETQAVSSP